MTAQTPVIDAFVAWQEKLTPQAAHRISQFVSKDVRVRNPQSEGAGRDAAAAIYAGYFGGTEKLTIRVTDRASGQDGHTAYLRWDRLARYADGTSRGYSGISEVMLDTEGRIASIIEHWDSVQEPEAPRGFFARLFKR